MQELSEIKELLDKVKSNVGAEMAQKIEDDMISISTKINSISTKNKELQSELIQVKAEAKDRRLALKDFQSKYENEIEDYRSKITELEGKTNNEELTNEIERLKKFEQDTIELQRNDFKSFVENVKDHAKFDRVKSRFKIPTNDDGIDFEGFNNIEHDDLKENLKQMRDLQELDYFDSVPLNHGSPPAGTPAQRGTDKTFNEKVSSATSKKELYRLAQEGA